MNFNPKFVTFITTSTILLNLFMELILFLTHHIYYYFYYLFISFHTESPLHITCLSGGLQVCPWSFFCNLPYENINKLVKYADVCHARVSASGSSILFWRMWCNYWSDTCSTASGDEVFSPAPCFSLLGLCFLTRPWKI